MNPLLATDAYKLGHIFQYPAGTEQVYSNWTPRASRIPEIDKVVFFGLNYYMKKYLQDAFEFYFFSRPIEEVMAEYKDVVEPFIGPLPFYTHIEALHKLGYLPLEIKALPEGTRVPLRTPMMTVTNTHPEFFWLPNFIETMLSTTLWQMCTTATVADRFRSLLVKYANQTNPEGIDFVDWQGHDFSFRGMSSLESATISGMAHLTSFTGTDTVPAIIGLKDYYDADKSALIAGSVPATEHAVMCAGGSGLGEEQETFRRLTTETYPNGIVSIVSDTWDLWYVLTSIVPSLKAEIMERDGKVVIRPDSGNPADILCGDPLADPTNPAFKGVVELLWDTFGGTVSSTGFKILDPHVGTIYGDAINYDRADEISRRLAEKGFASTNVVYGCGSFGYQFHTRDTFGFAMKATAVWVEGELKNIFKSPVTDDGTKVSAKGLIRVNDDLSYTDEVTEEEEKTGLLETVFLNGEIVKETTLDDVRSRLRG